MSVLTPTSRAPAAALALVAAAALPGAASARPGDLDRRVTGDGHTVVRGGEGSATFAPDGRLFVTTDRQVVRLRSGRVERRWRVAQTFPELAAPRPGGRALSVDFLTVRGLSARGRRDRSYGANGTSQLPDGTREVVPRPDGGLLVFVIGRPAELQVVPVSPAGQLGLGRRLTDEAGRPLNALFDAVPDGAGGAWLTVLVGQSTRLVHVGADGGQDGAVPAGGLPVSGFGLEPTRGGVLVVGSRTVQRVRGGVAGTPVSLSIGPWSIAAGPAVDARGRLLVVTGDGRLRRLRADGRRDRTWPRRGVAVDRGLPRFEDEYEEPFARAEGLVARRDGTIDLAVRLGGLVDERIDISEYTRAFAFVRLEGEDLVRIVSVRRGAGGSVTVRCLARARSACRVRVAAGRARGRATVRPGTRRRVRLRVPARGRATVVARATDGRGLVASDRRALGAR